MRIAIPVWNDRVSPVFDVARSIRVADIADGAVAHLSNHELENDNRAAMLAKIGVDLLICGAISIPLESTLCVAGVEVIPDTCGGAEEIITWYDADPSRKTIDEDLDRTMDRIINDWRQAFPG